GEYRVFNQFTEQFTVKDLAQKVRQARAAHVLDTRIVHLRNPRVEREEHYYNAKHQKLLDLGLQPHFLGDTLIESMIDTVERHAGGPPQLGGAQPTHPLQRHREQQGANTQREPDLHQGQWLADRREQGEILQAGGDPGGDGRRDEQRRAAARTQFLDRQVQLV